MRTTILTLDAGTSGLKCTLLDTSGQTLAAAVSAYAVNYPASGWAEQPVDWFLGAARDAVSHVVSQHGAADIAAIGLTGTMNGLIPIDEGGAALYPNIIHADTRAVRQLDQIRAVISEKEYYARTGNRLDVHFSLPKLLWLRETAPDIYQRAKWFVQTKDVLYGFLTGRYGYSDYSDASLTGALRIEDGHWDEALLHALRLDISRMPELRPSHDVSGTLSKETARLLGLTAGIPVAVGAGDGAAASHGAGLYGPEGAYCNLGTSAWMAKLSPTPVIDAGMRVLNYFSMDGAHYVICGTVQSGAGALEWVAENMLLGGRPFDAGGIAEIEALAAQSRPGADGVFFLPTLMGERTPWWDPCARGTFVGMSLHHTRADMARAAYEGVTEALRLCGDVMRENGLVPDRIALVGGGAQSHIWPQMFADVFGVPTYVHGSPRMATSLGAAMAAGVGAGLFADYRQAAGMVRFGGAHIPDAGHAARYADHFALYRTLYDALRDAYLQMYQYQQKNKF